MDSLITPGGKELLDQLNQGFLILNPSLTIVYANPALVSLLDINTGELYRTSFDELVSLSEHEVSGPDILRGGIFKFSLNSFSGRYLRLEFSFSPVINAKEEMIGCTGIVRDVFSESDTGEKLIRSVELYKNIAFACADWVWETDPTATFTFISEEVQNFLGYTAEQLFGRTPFEFMAEDEAERVASYFNRVALRGAPFRDMISTIITSSGEERVISTSGVPVHNQDGSLRGYRGSNRDITFKSGAVQDMKDSLEAMIEIFDELPSGVVVTDRELGVLRVNRAACSIVGVKPEEVLGRKCSSVFCSGCTGKCLMAYRSGRTVTCRFNLQRRDGGSIPVMKMVKPLSGSSEQRFIQVFTDLSRVSIELQDISSAKQKLEEELSALRESISASERMLPGKKNLHGSPS